MWWQVTEYKIETERENHQCRLVFSTDRLFDSMTVTVEDKFGEPFACVAFETRQEVVQIFSLFKQMSDDFYSLHRQLDLPMTND